jgi:alpha-tubulin suppressor-like RCC1 family protein
VAIKVVVGVGIPPEECTSPTDKRCITARRVRKYVADTKLVLPITMNDACRGVPCGADETCSRGRCVSVRCEDDGTCNPPPGVDDAGDASTVFDATDGSNSPDGARPDGGTSLPFDVSLGEDFSCVLRKRDGSVFCWGRNQFGQTGQAAAGTVPLPTLVQIPEKIVSLRATHEHVIALSEAGDVYGWGHRASGALGGGTGNLPPTRLWSGARAIGAGQRASCYQANQILRCIGQFIDGDYQIPGDGLQDFCVGTTHLLALTGDGGVVGAWGINSKAFPGGVDAGEAGEAGDAGGKRLLSLPISALGIHCGADFALASMADRTVFGWGVNSPYTLTDDRLLEDNQPLARSPSLDGFSKLSAGVDHACGVSANRTYCWGSNSKSQVNGTSVLRFTKPTDVGLVDAAEVYAGVTHSCAQFAGGRILCWGSNEFGQITIGPSGLTAPTEVRGLEP